MDPNLIPDPPDTIPPGDDPSPETAIQQLQNGIFTMVVTMVRTLESQGVSTATARKAAAAYLQSLLLGLEPASMSSTDGES